MLSARCVSVLYGNRDGYACYWKLHFEEARSMTTTAFMPLFSDRVLANLKAPGASNDSNLVVEGDTIRCDETGETFPVINGIP